MDNATEVARGPFQATLRALYLEQDLSLAEVIYEMATKHQFNATKSQYELQFKKWQFRKNRTAEEWKIVARKLTERKLEYKESEVVLNGNLINPKKLRKETLRYGSLSAAIEVLPPGPSPPTPEGFVIRTPSPKFTTSMTTTTEFYSLHEPINIGPILMDWLPFHQFNSVFGQAGNPFLSIPENDESNSIVLSQDIHSSVLEELTGKSGKVSGSLGEVFKALLPENVFPSNPTEVDMAMSQREPSSILQFLKLTIYLVSNNFFGSTTTVSKKVYRWIKRRSNVGLMEYLMSIGGPTVEALTENLFRLAIDAEDVRTIKKMMKLGINPNEQMYRTRRGSCRTPLTQACEMQSLKLVKALIDGGAKVDLSVGNNDPEWVLLAAVDGWNDEEECYSRPHIEPELVQILLDAGAIVNPDLRQSPLAKAVEWGHVEVVELLISAGADVNIMAGDDDYAWTPLNKAVECEDHIPDTDVISMVRLLLDAGADPQGGAKFEAVVETALEAAMDRKSIELIQLLLENGSRVTESSLVRAVRRCDINVVKLLLKFGGQVTESVIECAVQNNSTLVFFLLETTDDRIKNRCKAAALIQSIEGRKMDLIHSLQAAGAQLKKSSKLEDAIREVVRVGGTDVLQFLLDEKSTYRIPSLESLGSALWTAITNGRNDIVEMLLAVGANVNIAEGSNTSLDNSPLLAAIRNKDQHITKQLLVAGAPVNGSETSAAGIRITTTVLPDAVNWGCYPLIEDIINAGAEVDAPNPANLKTALFVAVGKKDAKSIQILIDAGANVNTSGAAISGQTALNAASRNNNLQMVQYLLGLGADPDEWSLISAVSGSLDLVRTLLAARLHRYKRFSKGYGCGALQHAIRLKNAAMIEVLQAEGIDANVIIHRKFGDSMAFRRPSTEASVEPYLISGESALGSAIKWDKSKDLWIVKMLLRGGADPNSIVTENPQTALLVAIEENNLALVKVLITAGADPNPSLRSGVKRTPLQLAVEKGKIDIVNVLLDNGVDINALPFDRYGATALQFAAIGGYIGIAQLLIQRGADVNASPAKIGGRTALEGAAEHGRIDMLQLLLSAGSLIIGTGLAQYDRARELALENGHRAAFQLLEKYNKDILENFAPWDDMWMDFSTFEEGLPL